MDQDDWLVPEAPANEAARLAELQSLGLLDSDSEYRFDSLTQLALDIVGGKNCLVSLVDHHRQWFKSTCQSIATETSRSVSFCAFLVQDDIDVLSINNTAEDPRFAQNPLVVNEPFIAAYLGIALRGESGNILGSLCILDDVPRVFTDEHIHHLKAIARLVEVEMRRGDIYDAERLSLATKALYDEVTKLPNKQYFTQKLQQHTQVQHIHNQYGQIAVLQIHRLRHIMRIYKESFCHRLMNEFAKRIRTSIPTDAFLAKLSEEQFIVYLPSVFSQSNVDYFAHVKEILEQPVNHQGTPVFVSTQIGVTQITNNKDSLDKHISRCLVAMENPDNDSEVYSIMDEEYERLSLRALDIENHLRNAINQNAFTMVYQPIVESYTETMIGVEALVRWRWKPNEFLSPAEFIPIAEEAGLILPLSQWILKTACIEFAGFQDEHQAPLYLSINISPCELLAHDFVEQVISACDIARLPYNQVQLEITEHALITDMDNAVIQLNKLHEKGIRIAIDDFGTGHSSLQYLHQLPVDVVKIDQSFIHNINTSEESNAIVKAIIALSHELGKTITAEGIETFEQAEFLRQESISSGQGWYYEKPMDIKTLLLKLTDLSFI